ncbi:MAG: hypothetical protein NC223_01595 [Butyrivibrio sp.]|nr:hypothetical protein [Butyrivibrio sp.]
MKNKILKTVYAALFLAAFAFPGVMSLVQKKETVGNEAKAELKELNYLNFAEKFDAYFAESFGLRNSFVNLNNRLKYALFNESGEKSVIAGRDGWLFYESALHDFNGEDMLSDEEINAIADMLRDTQDYVTRSGAEFVFAIAPNKMEIYGENMPYYCVESTDAGNYERLMEALDERGVNHTDLKSVLREAKEGSDTLLYHKLDSHWNSLGAYTAYASIMEHTGFEAADYSQTAYSVQDIFDGDLYGMLFPKGDKKDGQIVFDTEERFYYTSNFRGADDLLISTANDGGRGSLLMFRDSFGNALYPFAANDFERARFSRALPYDLTDAGAYDLVIIEIVERNIGNLLEYPPVLEAAE